MSVISSLVCFLFISASCFAVWWWADAQQHRAENRALRREIARLSKHPSTYHEPPLPYTKRYADED
ncbi:hypothetical protein CCUG60885_04207 [Mycobacteroides salmoniphilum]|uniref:Uncharacterized protein n=1 Tax=Mycobacteroides salmoniphilum TaxID=404941 RepID=A0A4R8SBY1_9MYCO|nr:hypothetical protein CCUG60885_04207 [Mycobacteroides salmoniphilum]TEA07323.1 hypothetical protein CCUG60883_01356 [Mycobacteroides salmoniphilum]